MSESLNEARQQVKRKYGEYPRIRINEKGATVRDTIINYVGKNYVREQDLNNYLIRLEEDRDGHAKINKVKFFKRNQKFFSTFEKNGEKYISLSKYGERVLELIKQDKKTPPSLNESTLRNIPSLSEFVEIEEFINESNELNENKGRKEYNELRKNPPELKVEKNPKEVTVNTVDRNGNKFTFLFNKKGSDFEFSADGWSVKSWPFGDSAKKVKDIEQKADDGDWNSVFDMILDDIAIEDVKSL